MSESAAAKQVADALRPFDGEARSRILDAAREALEGGAKGTFRGRAVRDWLEDLVSHNGKTRVVAKAAVRDMGSLADAEVARVENELRNPERWKRVMPAEALLQIGRHVEAAAAVILDALREDDSQDVRHTALGSIMKSGESAAAAVPGLLAALEDPAPKHPDVPALAAEALGWIGPDAKAAAPALRVAASKRDAALKKAAKKAIERIGER